MVDDFMASATTSSTITLTWSPPTAIVPTSYNIVWDCRRVCESSTTSSSQTSVSSPHTSTGIPPYSQCTFDLIGVYDVTAELTTDYTAETLSICKIIIVICPFIIILNSPYCTSG